jgi:hypothetical protein
MKTIAAVAISVSLAGACALFALWVRMVIAGIDPFYSHPKR